METTINIPLSEYKELLIIKGKYEELSKSDNEIFKSVATENIKGNEITMY